MESTHAQRGPANVDGARGGERRAERTRLQSGDGPQAHEQREGVSASASEAWPPGRGAKWTCEERKRRRIERQDRRCAQQCRGGGGQPERVCRGRSGANGPTHCGITPRPATSSVASAQPPQQTRRYGASTVAAAAPLPIRCVSFSPMPVRIAAHTAATGAPQPGIASSASGAKAYAQAVNVAANPRLFCPSSNADTCAPAAFAESA